MNKPVGFSSLTNEAQETQCSGELLIDTQDLSS